MNSKKIKNSRTTYYNEGDDRSKLQKKKCFWIQGTLKRVNQVGYLKYFITNDHL